MDNFSLHNFSESGPHSVIVPNSSLRCAHGIHPKRSYPRSPEPHCSHPGKTNAQIRCKQEIRSPNSRSPSIETAGSPSKRPAHGNDSYLLGGECMSFERMVNSPMNMFPPMPIPLRRKSDSDAFMRSSPDSFMSPSSTPVSPNSPGMPNSGAANSFQEDEFKLSVPQTPDSTVTMSPPDSVRSLQSNDSPLSQMGTPISSPMPFHPRSPEGSARPGGEDEHFIRVRPHLASPPAAPGAPCMICSDKSTGKHYGALSCDGCKGFFRRSIRKDNTYLCRFDRRCNMTKDRRNQCRHCRLNKCLEVGMKKEAVQNERDRISHRRAGPAATSTPKHQPGSPPPQPPPLPPPLPPLAKSSISLEVLLAAEAHFRVTSERRLEEMRAEGRGPHISAVGGDIASLEDVAESVKQQLYGLVDFAKSLPQFNSLHLEDRIKLLKAHSGEHLLLGIAWRSLATDGYLLLGINKRIPRLENGVTVPHGRLNNAAWDVSTANINWIASRVLDDIAKPLRQNQVNDQEFLCLRTMIFFDPMLHDLKDRESVQQSRLEVQLLLEDLIAKRSQVPARGRLGQIMFMLPYLQTISQAMTQQIQMVKKDGVQSIDKIISEMLLGSFQEDEKDDCHDTLPSPLITMVPHPTSRPECRAYEESPPTSDVHDRRQVRSPSSAEPCDLSYHHDQHETFNGYGDPGKRDLEHFGRGHRGQENAYGEHEDERHRRVMTGNEHFDNHDYYRRVKQCVLANDLDRASNFRENDGVPDVAVSEERTYHLMGSSLHTSNPKIQVTGEFTANNYTRAEMSRHDIERSQMIQPSSTLIDLSSGNMTHRIADVHDGRQSYEAMEHSTLECMDAAPLNCSEHSTAARIHGPYNGSEHRSVLPGRAEHLVALSNRVHSDELLRCDGGMAVDERPDRQSIGNVATNGDAMSHSNESERRVEYRDSARAEHYSGFEAYHRSPDHVIRNYAYTDRLAPQLPLNLRQRLTDR
ncbi:nuclear receptor subfamily 4 group A member 1 isoform X1 [Hyalella azteca]|uniref:Nuclear receptor subfamily 4 group A member 1 isoform X1 n=2 Tax=Hyalella azteca TaxID=294128 RepID=A0A979FK50_HYAAZ|nr:nuclear receptor subfamily 4 group A member 1 isoform X1 [Hyalella azteca]